MYIVGTVPQELGAGGNPSKDMFTQMTTRTFYNRYAPLVSAIT